MKKFIGTLILSVWFLGSLTAYAQTTSNVSVTATVPASANDFSAVLRILTSGSTFNQEQELEYQITYGSSLDSPTELIVEAQWYEGTLESNPSTTVDVLDYVIGSATDGYNSTPAVVDTTNKKITWTIANFPADTSDQTVGFKLKTNANYTGDSKVDFDVKARLRSAGAETNDSTVTRSYQYIQIITPTPTPTSKPSSPAGPSATPSPQLVTSSPQPTGSIQENLRFTDISIRNLTETSAELYIETNLETTINVDYGQSFRELNLRENSARNSRGHRITLVNLGKNQPYFFRVRATTDSQEIYSDIFTFTTSKSAFLSQIQSGTLIATSNDVILHHPSADQRVVVMPTGTIVSFTFLIKNPENIRSIYAVLRNRDILGLVSTSETEAPTDRAEVNEVRPGVYTTIFKTPPTPGLYELFIGISDTAGNINEFKLVDLKVISPLTVLNQNGKSIEGAAVTLYRYDQRKKDYERIPNHLFNFSNPLFTNRYGQIEPALPEGRYRANILAVGFERTDIEFTIGAKSGQNYPLVKLQGAGISVVTPMIYYGSVIWDLVSRVFSFAIDVTQSNRLLDLAIFFTLSVFVYFSYLALGAKSRIPLRSLEYYFRHHLNLRNTSTNNVVSLRGRVIGAGKAVLKNADIHLLNHKNKILNHCQTDSQGIFKLKTGRSDSYKLMIVATGYEPKFFTIENLSNTAQNHLEYQLDRGSQWTAFKSYVREVLSSSFESLLIATVILEVLIGLNLGWNRVIPFLALSILNALIWIAHQHRVNYERTLA